jgi:hypothetical protein
VLELLAYFLVTGIIYTSPLSLVVWLLRRRISRLGGSLILAAGFAIATAFTLWRMEWFDVWRHGIPRLSYILTEYGPPILIYATVGAALGAALSGGGRRR